MFSSMTLPCFGGNRTDYDPRRYGYCFLTIPFPLASIKPLRRSPARDCMLASANVI